MKNQVAFIGILVQSRSKSAPAVNRVLTQHGSLIVGRMGLPYAKKKCWIITLVLDAPLAQINTLLRQLDRLNGVTVTASCL